MRQMSLGTSQSHSTLPATPCACMEHLYLLPLLLLASLSGHSQRTRQDFVVKTIGDTLRGEFRKGFYRLPDRFSLGYVAGAGVLIRRRTGPFLNLEIRFDQVVDAPTSIYYTPQHKSLRLDVGVIF